MVVAVALPASRSWAMNMAKSEAKTKGTGHVPTSLVAEPLRRALVLNSVVGGVESSATNADVRFAVLLPVARGMPTAALNTPWHVDGPLVVSFPLCGVQDALLLVTLAPMR